MVKRFCPKCGNNISEEDIKVGFLCKKCYYTEHPLYNLETEYTIAFCGSCNAFKINKEKDTNKWIIDDEKDPLKIIKKYMIEEILKKQSNSQNLSYEIEFDQESLKTSNQNYVNCRIKGTDENEESSKIEICKINMKKSICPNCVNQLGKRFSSVIQLRKGFKNDDKLDKILNEIIQFVNVKHLENPEQNIVEVVDTSNGYDLKLSNIGILKKIYSYIDSKYNFIVKKSKTLVGVNPNTGGKLYRTYLLLRTLPVQIGDLIEYKNEQFLIKNTAQKSVQLENIKTKQLIFKKFKFFEKKTIKNLNS